MTRRALFVALVGGFALVSEASPALALALGMVLGLTLGNPWSEATARVARTLLKACVVGLGFGLSLPTLYEVGRHGIWASALAIGLTLGAGKLLARTLRVDHDTGALISGGTAICGGSAIAALGPALGASSQAMSAALATVFLLNGVALYLFPLIGHAFELTQGQFAVFSSLAIHDTSSVVATAAGYGPQALEQATVLKLTRALWIVPLTIAAAYSTQSRGGAGTATRPWFIALFVLAAAARGLWPQPEAIYEWLQAWSVRGLALTLFLLGLTFDRDTASRIGLRPFTMGLLLWALVTVVALAAVLVFPDLAP